VWSKRSAETVPGLGDSGSVLPSTTYDVVVEERLSAPEGHRALGRDSAREIMEGPGRQGERGRSTQGERAGGRFWQRPTRHNP